MRIVGERPRDALVGERENIGQRRVVERHRRCARHAAGHVSHAIMDDVVDHIGRVVMGGRPRGLDAAALVDRHVDDHGTRLHLADQVGADEFRRRSARDQHAADHQIRRRDMLLHRVARREDRVQRAVELRPETAQDVDAAVEHPDICPHAERDVDRMGADDTAAEHDDLGRIHPGHPAQQHAEPAMRLFQEIRADLDRHAAGDLRHRRQQRQSARRAGDGLVGDAGRAARHQVMRLRGIRREVEIGEEHLALAQHLTLGGQRLLHLHDHLRLGEDRGGVRGDPRAGGLVMAIGHPDPRPGVALDHDLVAMRDQFADIRRREADAVFADLDLLGNADAHDRLHPD